MNRLNRTRKTALLDASSAIILFKVDLHSIISEMYDVIMPASVYNEITDHPYPGAEEYRHLLAENKFTLQGTLPEIPSKSTEPGFRKLDRGEHDIIQLYYAGPGDFIITDDGAAAKYCKREGIPFVNALLVPVILKFAAMTDTFSCRESMDKIMNQGRYSSTIISFAENCRKEELSFFMP
ncbi:MAG: hypothetical protein KQH63_07655 [Desulfobulbaceae bacterium]|nr:hypothetical protein [Desulfobulbaceae bacterium]